jgi:site-specific DNA recombinase
MWRCVIYLKTPSADSPEDQLVVQFQGIIAEYERAQIAERHRRGKRHRAQQGMVNVLSGAPYRYVRKTDTSAAYYEVVDSEADVARMVFAIYTQQRFSVNAIARALDERGISTRTGKRVGKASDFTTQRRLRRSPLKTTTRPPF